MDDLTEWVARELDRIEAGLRTALHELSEWVEAPDVPDMTATGDYTM